VRGCWEPRVGCWNSQHLREHTRGARGVQRALKAYSRRSLHGCVLSSAISPCLSLSPSTPYCHDSSAPFPHSLFRTRQDHQAKQRRFPAEGLMRGGLPGGAVPLGLPSECSLSLIASKRTVRPLLLALSLFLSLSLFPSLSFLMHLAVTPRSHQCTRTPFTAHAGFLPLVRSQKSDELLTMPRDKVSVEVLAAVGGELNNALTNPFFGAL
jgi:hypothetical protein